MGIQSSTQAASKEIRTGLQENGQCIERGTNYIGNGMKYAGDQLKQGADSIAKSLQSSADVGKDVADAHNRISKAIPEAGLWVGGAGIAGCTWLAAGRNIVLTKHATVITGVYALTAAAVFGTRTYKQQHINGNNTYNNNNVTTVSKNVT